MPEAESFNIASDAFIRFENMLREEVFAEYTIEAIDYQKADLKRFGRKSKPRMKNFVH